MNTLKNLLGKSFKVVMFIVFTILWTLFVYLIEGKPHKFDKKLKKQNANRN